MEFTVHNQCLDERLNTKFVNNLGIQEPANEDIGVWKTRIRLKWGLMSKNRICSTNTNTKKQIQAANVGNSPTEMRDIQEGVPDTGFFLESASLNNNYWWWYIHGPDIKNN